MTDRIQAIKESGIRKIFDKAATMKNVTNMSIGQPDFPVPDKIKKDIVKALKEDKTGYTSSIGIKELREKVMIKHGFKKLEDKGFTSIITSGTTGGIFLSYSALMNQKEEIIIFEPYFVVYPEISKFLGIKPRVVKTNSDFSINFTNLENSITSKTKAIMVNSPSNPSGYIIKKEEVKKIIDIAKKNDLWIISDEIYSDFDYENKFVSFAGKYDKLILLSGFSKNFSLTGMRCGYAIGPISVINDMVKLQQYSYVCAPSAVQFGLVKNIDLDNNQMIKEFKERRDLVYDNIKDIFKVKKPDGAFYFFIKSPKNLSGTKFSEECLKHGLLIVPGKPFSSKDEYFRLSYTINKKQLLLGLRKLKKTLESIE